VVEVYGYFSSRFKRGRLPCPESLKAVAGERMKSILSRLTSNRLMGAFTGAFVTAIIQSSSACR
jgi:phosphate:Na+ symporter